MKKKKNKITFTFSPPHFKRIVYEGKMPRFVENINFENSVRLFSNPSEFMEYKRRLIHIDPELRDIFLMCLKRGFSIEKSLNALPIIKSIQIHTPLVASEIIKVAYYFVSLNYALGLSNPIEPGCTHDFRPINHQAVDTFERCTKCGKIR